MNREIKFRIWNDYDKKMIYWNELLKNKLANIFTIPSYNKWLMQYTGLHDKNGKEIYEGDIVKVNDEIIAEVIWDNDYLGYFLYANEENSIDSFENGEQPLYDYWGSIEVIGNIHENSELLGGE